MTAALITGASSGIGRALAGELAARGHDLLLVARGGEVLEAVAGELRRAHGVRVETAALDLSAPGAVESLVKTAAARGLAIDVLVNNAGAAVFGEFADAKWEDLAHSLALNTSALTELTHRLLPAMRERRRGRILMIASTAAFAPGPFAAVYAASKAYVLSFGQALAAELAGQGVCVTTVCPGRTDTAFAARSGWSDESRLPGRGGHTAEEVARDALRALDRGESLFVVGARNRLFALAARLLPPHLAAGLLARRRRGARK